MSVFRSRPAMRWLVPSAAAALVVGGGAAAGTLVANADPALPKRSAAQLLVDVQTASIDGLSGTVVQRADLKLPPITGLGGDATGGVDLMKLITGNNTVRVWYAGTDKARLSVLSTLGETDVIRNGTDLWVWNSRDNTATRRSVPADLGKELSAESRTELVPTPADAAALALSAIDPTTAVSTTGTATVAGRDAYELVLVPRDTGSLVGQVRLAVDAEEKVPLRVDVYAKDATAPAVRIGFEQVSFAVPDAEQFAFNPPPGATVTDLSTQDAGENTDASGRTPGRRPAGKMPADKHDETHGSGPTVVGKGWTSIVVVKLPSDAADKALDTAGKQDGFQLDAILKQLPKVSGTWGSGRLLSSALFSALLTDDGRLLVGAVTPEKLYEAAAG